METKFTKGPWFAVNYAGYIQLQKSPFYDHGNNDLLDQGQTLCAEANGNLAAAAPDLLKASELAILELQLLPCKCDKKVIDALENALKKAKGE